MPSRIAVVTGAAGFIGSHLVESLLDDGWSVRGVDAFTEYYSTAKKRGNLRCSLAHDRFALVEADTADQDAMAETINGADALFHLAAEAGVRSSWGQGFDRYVDRNVLGTQRLLEAARSSPSLRRIVVASSSSVYGDAEVFPTPEETWLRPQSPYGITKAATEHLTTAYTKSWGLPTVILRFFTVFGPRQRPDMAFYRIIDAALSGTPFPLYGTGEQVRDFTYVRDVVTALHAACDRDITPGMTFNVAGGAATSLLEAITVIEELTGATVELDPRGEQAGDAQRTGGDTSAIRSAFDWSPQTGLVEGLREQIASHSGL